MRDLETYEVIIVGGGKGGKRLAVDLGSRKCHVALIERSPTALGGTSINLASIPAGAMLASARLVRLANEAKTFGVETGPISVNWPTVKRRASEMVDAMRTINLRQLQSFPSLDFIVGTARFYGPRLIEVREDSGRIRRLTAEKIFINTGTRPAIPDIPGLADVSAYNSQTILRIDAPPPHLIVLGAGYIALELAQIFRRVGSEVTVIARGSHLLSHEDPDISEMLAGLLMEEGIDIRLNTTVTGMKRTLRGTTVDITGPDGNGRIKGSDVLAALGRNPNTDDLNLPAAEVDTDEHGFIQVNPRLETTAEGVWAIGEVNGGPHFSHTSVDDYRIVRINVFEGGNRTTADRHIPFMLFTEPELARVGLTEKAATEAGRAFTVTKIPISKIPRAKVNGRIRGIIKILVEDGTGLILGCSILGNEAGEILGPVQVAMQAGLPATVLHDTPFAHPALVEGLNLMFTPY